MAEKIDPREVLAYLNELGFTNINAQQLKDFITDLKKLIKYERKHRKDNVDTYKPTTYIDNKFTSTENLDQSTEEQRYPFNQSTNTEDKQSERDVFNELYSQSTIASKAKEVPRRRKHISVHITKPKTKTLMENPDAYVERHLHSPGLEHRDKIQENEEQILRSEEVVSDGSKVQVDTETGTKECTGPCSKPTSSKLKQKSSFIRPSYSKTFNKCDPVSLYHYYQEQWKKQKFPGKEHHSDLRWAVREKLLSGPKVNIPSTASNCYRRFNSWKG